LTRSEDFIAEAAHRVRTPLATVRSYAEAMLQRVEKEENRQAMRSMIRAVDESSRAAGQLLDHAMITLRVDNLDRRTVNLSELVTDLVIRLTPIAEMRDVQIKLEAGEAIQVSADVILIQNAIRNLIDNALKYAPQESVVDIVIVANPRPEISIKDEGTGFPNEEMHILANRFERGSNSESITGSGLGLTIAQDVAEAHGGRLSLSNQVKGGACVTFSF